MRRAPARWALLVAGALSIGCAPAETGPEAYQKRVQALEQEAIAFVVSRVGRACYEAMDVQRAGELTHPEWTHPQGFPYRGRREYDRQTKRAYAFAFSYRAMRDYDNRSRFNVHVRFGGGVSTHWQHLQGIPSGCWLDP